MKNIRKHVLLALTTMGSTLAFAAPPANDTLSLSTDNIRNIYVSGNTDSNYASGFQSQGVFISSGSNPSPYYDGSGNFSGEFSNTTSLKPFASGYFIGTNEDPLVNNPGNTTSTKAFSGNYANFRSDVAFDASGVSIGNQVQSDGSGNYFYTPVSGHASTADYDASGNLRTTTVRSGNLTPQGDIASGNFSTASYNANGELGITSNTSFATNINNSAYSLNSQIVDPNGYAANISGVVNTDGGSAATTIALTGPEGNALLANLTGSLGTNTLSGTISGAGAYDGLFGSNVAGGVITGSVTLGSATANPSASTSVYLTNLDGSASQTSFVTNTSDSTVGQSMNLDATGNASVLTGVTAGLSSAGSSAATDGSGNFSTYTGVKDYANNSFAGTASYLTSSGSSGAYISGGRNNGAMYFDSNGVTVGRVDGSGNIVNTSQIHGVAAGTAQTDAVNVSQLNNMSSNFNSQLNGLRAGVASTVAMANIPQVDQGKRFAIGAGLGHYDGASALSVGGSIRVNENAVIKGSLAHSFNTSGPAETSTAVGVGAAYSW